MSDETEMTSLALIATSDAAHGARELSRSDRAAVQMALQAAGDAVVICPAGDKVAVEYAIAAGIRDIYELGSSPSTEFQIVYVGSGAAELVGDTYLARWAELSKATLLFDVTRCSQRSEALRDVECDAGRGARYHLSVCGPLIMVMSSHIARPAYVSRYRRQAATQQVSGERSSAHDQVARQMNAHEWNPVRPRVRVRRGQNEPSIADDRLNDAFSIQAGSKDETNVIIADPETCARHILRYLSHHGFVAHVTSDAPLHLPEVRQWLTESDATRSVLQPGNTSSLAGFIERRPRQAEDLPARRARQPRSIDKLSQPNSVATVEGFLERRPRQADDSTTRRARQPRPVEKAKRENDV